MKTITLAVLAVAVLAAGGCEQAEVKEIREAGVATLAPGEFSAEITFCRRVGSKTGKRIEIDETFPVREGKKYKYVYGFADIADVPVDRDHQLHLIWLKPDGTELFRRFGTVRVTAAEDGYLTRLVWLDAEDLNEKDVEEPVATARPLVSVSSRIDVRPERERDLGAYTLKVYWNRELLTQRAFELTAES